MVWLVSLLEHLIELFDEFQERRQKDNLTKSSLRNDNSRTTRGRAGYLFPGKSYVYNYCVPHSTLSALECALVMMLGCPMWDSVPKLKLPSSHPTQKKESSIGQQHISKLTKASCDFFFERNGAFLLNSD